MVVVRGLDKYRPDSRRAAVAIGNFDGIHLGHLKILNHLRRRAQKKDLHSLVLTFFPHPERALGKKEIRMIQTLDQRLRSLEESGIATVIVTNFDDRFSRLPPARFMEFVLEKKLNAAEIVVGSNFRFGRNRQGDTGHLSRLGEKFGMAAHIIPPKINDGKVVSSSAIRIHLGQGRTGEAARLLGRPYEIAGKVIRGRSRGKALGFPTANIRTENEILPDGVFLTRTMVDAISWPSLTSIGSNPTFEDGNLSVETFLLDFDKGLYGRNLRIRFLERIRKTRIFKDSDGLVNQMKHDLARAYDYFKDERAPV
jgi:riboflavin kinase/FMN adenylyltransferase